MEAYVSLEIAKLLQNQGFDWSCGDSYHNNEGRCICSKPTIQMAMAWLRKECDLYVDVKYIDYAEHGEVWSVTIVNMLTFTETDIQETENTYEQAAELGIKYCLENLI
jgi:hypothetical protein